MKNLKKPVIGMTSSIVNHNNIPSVNLHQRFVLSVKKAGGIPLIIPSGTDEMAEEWASICDGIILTSGEDVDPHSFNKNPDPKLKQTHEKRDKLEIALVKQAKQKKKPILGICRGNTMLNVALGGTLVQDIPSHNPNAVNHNQKAARPEPTHSIQINENSWLYKLLHKSTIRVNSMHHQAIDKLGSNLKEIAVAPDGTVEAVEGIPESPVMWGVQWHPEEMASEDPTMQLLFEAFINECR
ncbi:gamma-glutamyl-gamma-aminobutyrate hydrolase family protein [Alkalihalobacillus deserti]|uniref:gamma-glutamyl-gamma-aminobutyrate hydrolase family protein n=1 Tax=Alkalihalobacillus deserti TaxID=2879466 RepID=UPI001D13F101|nr:gamma-glutamyl-gamma-aminobutyrate hydrolase family protein [Alkalihalobacillus deserti]